MMIFSNDLFLEQKGKTYWNYDEKCEGWNVFTKVISFESFARSSRKSRKS